MVDFPKTPTTAIEKELTQAHGFPRDQCSTETVFYPFERTIQVSPKHESNSTPLDILPISLSALIPVGIIIYLVLKK